MKGGIRSRVDQFQNSKVMKPRGRDPHREFCSFYIELGRLTTSQGLHLLEKLEWADIEKLKPHPELVAEMASMGEITRPTITDFGTMARGN